MDNPDVPYETCIYYSKWKLMAGSIILVGLMGLGVFIIYNCQKHGNHDSPWFMYPYAAFMILFPVIPLIKAIKKLSDKNPQIVLDNRGIQLKVAPKKFFSLDIGSPQYYAWEEIGSEYVDERPQGRSKVHILSFISSRGDVSQQIGDLDTNQDDLNYLLQVYRQRGGKGFYSVGVL